MAEVQGTIVVLSEQQLRVIIAEEVKKALAEFKAEIEAEEAHAK